ncbi:unnamed protein product [Brassicogethes aeneus]|uniref:Caspase family p20 domain-containing protein n=1 Tax=Brassicogethes aeneus TaxID=1431903 RepID=A0A9P0FAK9_BRAAE|nr:unnamed protein product [Brassicogethes aeneus]
MSEVHTDGRSYTPNKNNVPRKKINLPLEYISTDISPPNNNVFVVPDGEKKFIERDYKNCKLSYPRDKNDPGKIIIINYEFADKEPRIGSRRDVNEMILCLQRQGYNIYENDILTDKSKEYVLDYLEEVAKSQLSDVNCLMVFFFTHGKECNKLSTIDYDINVEEIYKPFKDCLKNKPKMFIFQACKGKRFTTTKGVRLNAPKKFKKQFIKFCRQTLFKACKGSAFSTTKGSVSDYDETSGFIPFGTLKTQIPEDMIFYFSTIEGTVATSAISSIRASRNIFWI